MYFLYLKSNGEISVPVHRGNPSQWALDKKPVCELGSGIKWENVDLFYAPDEEFPEDFARTAPLGKYRIENNEVQENLDWQEPDVEMAIVNKVEEIRTKQDEIVDFLKSVPFSKVDSYVDNNVTNLASAKVLLKKMIKAILWLYKE